MVKPVVSTGIPAVRAMQRATLGSSVYWLQLPKITSSICSGARPARRTASSTAIRPSSREETVLKEPPKSPTGVRTALTKTTSSLTIAHLLTLFNKITGPVACYFIVIVKLQPANQAVYQFYGSANLYAGTILIYFTTAWDGDRVRPVRQSQERPPPRR